MTSTPPSGETGSSSVQNTQTAQRAGGRGLRRRTLRKILGATAAVVLAGGLGGGIALWGQYQGIIADLPTVEGLRSYQPPVMSRLYAQDDQLVAELANERRIFVPYNAIPDRVKNAFIAAEDQKFWTHNGVDPAAILRAGLTDLTRGKGRRPIGASTITQQVARIMLLGTNAVSFRRKAKEAFLAMRVEQVLPKEKILEIYLNEIYLGNGAYGIGAAAQTYFNKPLDQLDDAEAAFLGALPKSPTNYNPERFPDAARGRRNWVLERMADIGALTPEAARTAAAEPLNTRAFVRPGPAPGSEWFAEQVRRELIDRYGQDMTMQGGLDVHTSLDLPLQRAAQGILRQGLLAYDRAHRGWQGAVKTLPGIGPDTPQADWTKALAAQEPPAGIVDQWRLAVVLDAAKGRVGWLENSVVRRAPPSPTAGTDAAAPAGAAQEALLLARDLTWARRSHPLHNGDVVMVEPQATGGRAALMQVPLVEGAVVTLDAHTGRVLALVGGWSFQASQFNRATQALRQPGSSFKPFVYLTAMEQGISPSQEFEDSPVSYGTWHPNNYEKDFWGPTTLHDALRESRNLVTIRLAAHIGMKAVSDMAIKLGLVDTMPQVLPAALGAVETTVLKEAAAYATLASGGRRITPTLIDDVQDRQGRVLWRASSGLTLAALPEPSDVQGDEAASADKAQADAAAAAVSPVIAPAAAPSAQPTLLSPESLPMVRDDRPRVATEQSAFQVTTMLQDVIRRGTGVLAGQGIDVPVAGKTGTSQNFNDAWFAGYTPDTVTVVWIGFDTPQSLGRNETGGAIAGPIWNKVMKVALTGQPRLDFPVPPGIMLVRYDTGRGVAVDAFKDGQIPGESLYLADGSRELTAADTGAENMPDSESDMAATGTLSGAPSGASEEAGGGAEGAGHPAQPASGGDIGMGGLY
jgi:penicillin-binding protein 1A